MLLAGLGFAPQAAAQVFTIAGTDSQQIMLPDLRTGRVAGDVALLASAVAGLPDGGVVAFDSNTGRLARIDPSGHASPVTATGGARGAGDGGPAERASLSRYATNDLAVGADGSVFLVDGAANTVRRIGADEIITTIAGDGRRVASGDGGPALAAGMTPRAIAVEPRRAGALLIAGNGRVRRVTADGIITTVAGTGARGTSGDGGPATHAPLSADAVSAMPGGGFLVAGSGLVRRVTADGRIATVAGAPGPPASRAPTLADGVQARGARWARSTMWWRCARARSRSPTSSPSGA